MSYFVKVIQFSEFGQKALNGTKVQWLDWGSLPVPPQFFDNLGKLFFALLFDGQSPKYTVYMFRPMLNIQLSRHSQLFIYLVL